MNSEHFLTRAAGEPLTVLFEVESLDKGGLENVVFNLVSAMDQELFRPVVVCTRSGGEIADRLQKQGIPVEVLGQEKERAYLVLLDRYGVDLVFTHHSFLGTPLAHRMNVPVLHTLHNMYFWFQPDVISVIREQDPFVQGYAAVSDRVKEYIVDRFKIDGNKISVIPNGLDLAALERHAATKGRAPREEWGLDKEDLIFLNVAAINPVKNQNLILEALADLKEDLPQLKVLMVGKVLNASYGAYLKQKVQSLELEEKVKFIEFTDRIYELYELSDAFILPSFIEGWSLAAMEAHCFGLPLILSNVGGAEELLDAEGKVTIVDLFPEGIAALETSEMLRLAEMPRPDQVQALVHAIRSTADMIVKNGHVSHGLDLSQAQRFSLEKMVRTYEREMLKILAQTGRTARREGVTDLRTRLEHIFREIWDQRTLLGTVTDWFRELNTSSNVTRDSVSNLRESMLQRIGQQEQTIIQEQQALENRLVSREQRLLEQSEHLIANHAGELNLRLSQMENELLRLNQVNSHLSNQLQVISARVSSVAANQWVILQRLSFKERLLSLWRRLSDRRVEPPYQPQVKTVYQDTKEPEPHPKSRKEETDTSPVIRRYPVFCFPIIDWGYRYQRPQHLLSRFAARGHQVYYFTAQMSIALERYSIKPLMENIVEVRLSAPRDMNIYISQLDEGSLEYLVKSIEELVREQELKEVVMLVQFPFWQPLAEVLRNKNGWKLIYDCMDEHTGFEIIGNQFAAEESALLSHSDLVTVSSQKLLEKAACNSNNYLLLPNAAEFDHFHDPQSNGKVRLSRPVLGYFGALAEWFDYDTIIYAAQQHPEWNFLIVGGHHSPEVENLKNLPNLMLTGEVSYQDLPGYLYYFDICLIPMRITPLIEATNPVKFFEYMASGKPIVAADLPELRPYQELYYCYHDHDDFIEKVKKALEERDPALVEKRLHTARKNHWDDRFETLRNGIENLYPLVSIIITSYNNLAYLKQCLDSVYSNSIYPRIEVIVVDNASQAETVSYLKEKEGERDTLQVIYNQKNVGFARANNQGMKLARGDYFALLNDDVVVTLGWLSGLLHYFKNGDVGMVGPVTNSAGNEACIPVPYRDLGDMEAFARDYTRKNQGKFFEIDVLAFFCTIISRRVWEDVGSLDEQFEIGMFEDDDYALRVKQRGLKLICAQDVFVHHFGRASFSRLEDAAYKELFNRNKQRFEDKWARPWSRHKSL